PSAIKGTYRSGTGKPVSLLFGLIAEGLFREDDFADVESSTLKEGIPKHTFGPVRPGDIRYADLNHDNVIDALDNTAIGGTFDPRVAYGCGADRRSISVGIGF